MTENLKSNVRIQAFLSPVSLKSTVNTPGDTRIMMVIYSFKFVLPMYSVVLIFDETENFIQVDTKLLKLTKILLQFLLPTIIAP